ncbi:MAG: hypothetical protein AAGG48_14660 [Planctomycetota bacterium]
MKVYYKVIDHCEGSVYECESEWVCRNPEYVANDCAEHYYGFHDGWEDKWPLTFALLASEDGPEVCRVSVDLEFSPDFFSCLLPKEEAGDADQ